MYQPQAAGVAPGGGVPRAAPPPPPIWVDLLSGFASAGLGKLNSAPAERIKLVIQLQHLISKRSQIDARELNGIIPSVRYIYRTEGPLGFFKTFALDALRYIPTQASNIVFRDVIRNVLPARRASDGYGLYFASQMAAGAVAGGLSLLLVYPFDYVNTLWAVNLANPSGILPYSSIKELVVSTYKEHGITGFYPGLLISILGIVLYRGFYFGIYDSLRPQIGRNPSFMKSFALGYCTTLVAGLISYPVDTVRRTMMITHSHDAWATAKAIVEESGVQGLFAGASANIIRSIVSSVVLILFDVLTRA